jgi:hypothetical protein
MGDLCTKGNCVQISHFYVYFQLFIEAPEGKIKSSKARKPKIKGGKGK